VLLEAELSNGEMRLKQVLLSAGWLLQARVKGFCGPCEALAQVTWMAPTRQTRSSSTPPGFAF